MRAVLPHPGPLPLGEGERFFALLAAPCSFSTIHTVVLLAVLAFVCSHSAALAAEAGDAAIVIFNSNSKDSKAVAEHYAKARRVPARQVFGFDLPDAEIITRAEFRDKLQDPLLARLERDKLFVFAPSAKTKPTTTNEFVIVKPISAKIRYAVLCYGVPLKIQNDPSLSEEGADKARSELRRNDAAVDSELALLPLLKSRLPLFGPISNRLFATTNTTSLHPTNGILLVTRLDGPSPEIARGLVDKALQGERDGLWGRAYFDARGMTNGAYLLGDEWIRTSAAIARRAGFETMLDDSPETFSAAFPMSHIALYAGWYDGNVSGPFARPKVEFMPGAVAYHLHSFSAATLRSTSAHWSGPLLDRGVTATMGCVEEPFLGGTPDLAMFFARFVFDGFSFGEAAYASQGSLSWQTTVIGDPLYRPFQKQPQQRHAEFEATRSKLLAWSLVRAMNQNMDLGEPIAKYVEILEKSDLTQESAVLLEKLGDLYTSLEHFANAADNYRRALEQGPSPQQQLRLMLVLGKSLEAAQQEELAYAAYQRFLRTFPDYADAVVIYRKLHSLAVTLGKDSEKEKYAQELDRIAPGAK